MDPKSLQGGTMDKERLGEMFKEFMEQQNVAQCRIVPKQVFGSRWAAPCAPLGALDPKRLRGMKKVLATKAILPLITERPLESAALLDLFLAGSGYKRPPSILQFFEHGQDFRCGNHGNWRHGRYHSGLEECKQNKGRVNQAGLLLTNEMRQTVLDFYGLRALVLQHFHFALRWICQSVWHWRSSEGNQIARILLWGLPKLQEILQEMVAKTQGRNHSWDASSERGHQKRLQVIIERNQSAPQGGNVKKSQQLDLLEALSWNFY